MLDDIQPALCRSVGWVHREDKQAITILSTHAEHHDEEEPGVTGIHCILKVCIKRRVKLKDPSRV